MSEGAPLVLVSNRGPVTYQEDGSIKRGTGGLATALIGLASHRDSVWIASAMTDRDVEVSDEHGGGAFEVEAPEGGNFKVRFVASDPEAYDRSTTSSRTRCSGSSSTTSADQSNAPDIRRHEVEAFEFGYNVVNEDLAEAVLEEIEGQDEPVVMVHDYQLYTLPGMIRKARPDAFRTTSCTSRGRSRTPGACSRSESATRSTAACSPTTSSASTRAPTGATSCSAAATSSTSRSTWSAASCTARTGDVWVRAYPLPIDWRATQEIAGRGRVREFEERLLRRRRDYSILRVDRADLSKNVLRGFTGFDIFLEQHPEFIERITFTAQLMPSRTDVPEYAEYLERIEALVAVVNHRHGTPDWMPIDLKLRDDLDEAVSAYKHYDVMMVNAMFDGMNLVAKEGPLVNERDGVSILSENTGAHEELGEFALSVNPFDVQEAGGLHIRRADHGRRRARPARRGAQGDRHVARSGGLDRRADRRHPQEGARGGAAADV